MVADGRADLAIAASRPNATPNPGVRESFLADDAIVCAVPPAHAWAARGTLTRAEFLAMPMVVRDPSSNARWTVDAVLEREGLVPADPLLEAPTPRAALAEARRRGAPVLLSRHIVAATDFAVVGVDDLEFPRSYVIVTPAYRGPTAEVRELIERIRDYVRIRVR